jgi:hypothetical protein
MIRRFLSQILNWVRYRYSKYRYPSFYELSPGEKKWHSSAKKKIILPSLLACNNLTKGKSLAITLSYQEMKSEGIKTAIFPIEFDNNRNDSSIKFKITNPNPFNVPGVGMLESYGLGNQLTIKKGDGKSLFIKENSIVEFETEYPRKPQVLKGKLLNLSTNRYEDLKDLYFRLIIRIDDPDITYPTDILEDENFLKFDNPNWDRQKSLMGLRFMSKKGQYSKVNIHDLSFDFYTIEDIQCQIIDSNEKTDVDTFKSHTYAIRASFALLSGIFYRMQICYVSSKHSDFREIENVLYEYEGISTITEMKLINPTLFYEHYKKQDDSYQALNKQYHRPFSIATFSNLCTEMLTNKTVARTIELILSGNSNLNPIQKGVTYSVAIETLANEIYSKNKKTLKPITDKAKSSLLKVDLKKVLDTHQKNIGEEAYNIISAKIEQINQPTNRNRLLLPFTLFGINLTEDEVRMLEHRNDFLHGKEPVPDQNEIERIALDFHHLIGCLLLKTVGYSGYITNLAVAHILKDETKANKYLNIKPSKILSVNSIQDLIAQGKIDEARDALEHTMNAYKAIQKLSTFIRII